MRSFFSGAKFKLAVSLCCALLLGIFIASVTGGGSSPLTGLVSYIASPLSTAAAHISEKLSSFRGGFASAQSLREEIASLNAELDECRSMLADYEKTVHKLDAYEDFLDVKEENPDYALLPATVILRDTSDVYGSFTINRGYSHGVQVNQPVICGNCLAGVVKEVTENAATVYTLYNPKVSVSAYEIRTREDCFTRSTSALALEGVITAGGLSRTTPIVSGGIICTSGIGGIYPRDLLIGSVAEVRQSETDISSYAVVTPYADPSTLVDVFVITDFEGKAQ